MTWSCLGLVICASPILDILSVKFDSRLTFEDHVHGIVSRVSQRICIFRLVKHVFVDTSVLLRCYYAFVLSILEYCCPVWGSAAKCYLQLLERQVYSVARLCHDQTFLSLCHRRHVAALCKSYKVNSNSNHCVFSELPSTSVRVWQTRVAAAAHTLEFEVSRCRTSQFERCFLPALTRVCEMTSPALCLTPERYAGATLGQQPLVHEHSFYQIRSKELWALVFIISSKVFIRQGVMDAGVYLHFCL